MQTIRWPLDGAVAVVTGAARGIGECVAQTLARSGAQVWMCDVDQAALDEALLRVRSAAEQTPLALLADTRREADVEAAVARVVGASDKIDILVNCAGITRATALEEMELHEWNLVCDVNLTGSFLWAKHVLPLMRKAMYGRVVMLSSIAAIAGGGFVGSAHYAASKAGVSSLIRSIAKQFGACGVTANAVAPGPIRTRMSETWLAAGMESKVAGSLPVGRIGEPNDVADAVAFLASPCSGFITGQTIFVDGGASIGLIKTV